MEASGVNDVIGPSENTGDPLVQSKWQIIGAISVIEAIGVNSVNSTNESPRHWYQCITNVAIDAIGIILANDTIFTIVTALHCRECHFREGAQNGRQQGAPMPNVTPLRIY